MYLCGFSSSNFHQFLFLDISTEDVVEEELETQIHMVYKNAQATSAKMKELQEETAKDFCFVRIARCY